MNGQHEDIRINAQTKDGDTQPTPCCAGECL